MCGAFSAALRKLHVLLQAGKRMLQSSPTPSSTHRIGDTMDLGPYASYRLPATVQTAFGAQTAQDLADQLGLTGKLTAEVGREAERAYNGYRTGDTSAAAAFLKNHTTMDEATIAEVLSTLPAA
jgi:hypothetical protein